MIAPIWAEFAPVSIVDVAPKVSVPGPATFTVPSSNVTPLTPVTVPLTVTVYEPVALEPAENVAIPDPAVSPCQVAVAPPLLLVLQFAVEFWSQVPGAVTPELEPVALPFVSHQTVVWADSRTPTNPNTPIISTARIARIAMRLMQ